MRGRFIAGIALAVAFGAAGLAPFSLMLLPNPVPVEVSDISVQMPGNFVESDGHVYHVFPYAEEVTSFPKEAPVVGPDAVFIVKYRQLAQLSAYTVWSFETHKEVSVARDTSEPKLLQLRPETPLTDGRYYAVVARESIYGGEDYVYFEVESKGEQP